MDGVAALQALFEADMASVKSESQRVAMALERIAEALERQIAAQEVSTAFARLLIEDAERTPTDSDQTLAPDGLPWRPR